ncbi:MAG TPA: hypothetical protein VID30_22280 [Bradyrhizobium sp.]
MFVVVKRGQLKGPPESINLVSWMRRSVKRCGADPGHEPPVGQISCASFAFGARESASHDPQNSVRRKTHFVRNFKPIIRSGSPAAKIFLYENQKLCL